MTSVVWLFVMSIIELYVVYEVGGEVHLLSNSMYQNNYLKTSHHLHIT